MGKLNITESSGGVRELSLDKERVSLGRHADNDVCLNDKAVSGHHAVIITMQSDAFLEDLDSTNGTLVNGRQIAKHALSHGDTITIGRNSMVFLSERAAAAARPMTPQAAPVPTLATTQDTKAQTGRLRVETGSSAGRELELTKAVTTVGKPGVQVAAITRRADGYYIMQVGAAETRRPVVNGREIDATAQKLRHEDLIELAGTQMKFLLP